MTAAKKAPPKGAAVRQPRPESDFDIFSRLWFTPIKQSRKNSTMTRGDAILKMLMKMAAEGDCEAAELFDVHLRDYPPLEAALCQHHRDQRPYKIAPLEFPVLRGGNVIVPSTLRIGEVGDMYSRARSSTRFWNWLLAVHYWEVEWRKKNGMMKYWGAEPSTPESIAFFEREGRPVFVDGDDD